MFPVCLKYLATGFYSVEEGLMQWVVAVSTTNGIIGWGLIAIGGLTILLAVAASAIEAMIKALQSQQVAFATEGQAPPWDKVITLIGEILKELMGKTGGPTFVMGLIMVVLGILVLHEKLL
jgi:hypothetical protein